MKPLSYYILIIALLMQISCSWYIDKPIPNDTIEMKLDPFRICKYDDKCIWLWGIDGLIAKYNLETKQNVKIYKFDRCDFNTIPRFIEGKKYLYFLSENRAEEKYSITIVSKKTERIVNRLKNWKRFENIHHENFNIDNSIAYHDALSNIQQNNHFNFKTFSNKIFNLDADADTFIQVNKIDSAIFSNRKNGTFEIITNNPNSLIYHYPDTNNFGWKTLECNNPNAILYQNKLYCLFFDSKNKINLIDSAGKNICTIDVEMVDFTYAGNEPYFIIDNNNIIGVVSHQIKHEWLSITLKDKSYYTYHHQFIYYNIKSKQLQTYKYATKSNNYYNQ
ncbi:MAG: hypothetical protein RJA07_2099 [Bacteroidota bacterium]|jgi:hypothetical protein